MTRVMSLPIKTVMEYKAHNISLKSEAEIVLEKWGGSILGFVVVGGRGGGVKPAWTLT